VPQHCGVDRQARGFEVELYLLRHAHAGDASKWTADDASRPLTDKGRRQAEMLGAHLARVALVPDAIVSSPKVRALETAQIVGAALGVEVTVDKLLGGRLDLDALDTIVVYTGGRRVVVVGHDPDSSEICAELTGARLMPMKKGSLARIDCGMPLRRGGGVLRWLIPPEALAPGDAR
jgi:phosphohistidine phosphatase